MYNPNKSVTIVKGVPSKLLTVAPKRSSKRPKVKETPEQIRKALIKEFYNLNANIQMAIDDGYMSAQDVVKSRSIYKRSNEIVMDVLRCVPNAVLKLETITALKAEYRVISLVYCVKPITA